MSKKAELLKERFEKLKDRYLDRDGFTLQYTITEDIIAVMLKEDLDEGIRMWEYMLQKYVNCKHPVNYTPLTNHVIETADYGALKKAFKSSEIICEHVYKLDPYENHLDAEKFIAQLVYDEEFELAETLINLYMQNDRGENKPKINLYELLTTVVSYSNAKWEMTSAGIDYISKWIAKLEDEGHRAEIEVVLLSVIDCVENGAPRGAMPFGLFMAEGGTERFMEEKERQSKAAAQSSKSARTDFEDFIQNRSTRNTKSNKSKDDDKYEENDCIEEDSEEEEESTGTAEKQQKPETLEDYMKELNELIGLGSVKAEVANLTNLIRVSQMRKKRDIKVPDTSQHLVFLGNPGTGKTTVARLIGKIYNKLGYLEKGHCVEVDRSELVAGYVGQTAMKTQEVIDSAMGGVLFIDEAYSLYAESAGTKDFGQESIETILKEMEDHRDEFIVIVAGYPEPMKKFINSNPGLKSRFNKYVYFPDYSGDELYEIFKLQLKKNQYQLQDGLDKVIRKYFDSVYENRGDNFANGREVRNFFEKLVEKQAGRVVSKAFPTDKDLVTITVQDFLAAGGTIDAGYVFETKETQAPVQDKRIIDIQNKIYVLESKISGMKYYIESDAEREKLRKLKPGDVLKLVREPYNEYDKNAVAVYLDDNDKIGFLARTKNEMLARMMDAGKEFIAIVNEPVSEHNSYGKSPDEAYVETKVSVYMLEDN